MSPAMAQELLLLIEGKRDLLKIISSRGMPVHALSYPYILQYPIDLC
jgi:hypothetical protein